MGLSFQPESIATARARYAAALTEVFDVESINLGTVLRPGECRANVFDFADGIRMIVSRDRLPTGKVVLHVSASLRQCGPIDLIAMVQVLACRFSSLSGFVGELGQVVITHGCVAHWNIAEVADAAANHGA